MKSMLQFQVSTSILGMNHKETACEGVD